MHVQEMINYLKAYYPEMLKNKTIDQSNLLTMLFDIYGIAFERGHHEGYEKGHVDGYELGYDEGYSEAREDYW